MNTARVRDIAAEAAAIIEQRIPGDRSIPVFREMARNTDENDLKRELHDLLRGTVERLTRQDPQVARDLDQLVDDLARLRE